MANHDGNGWTRCGLGHRHWGLYGAAGLLACAPGGAGRDLVLLQRRNWWGNHGGTWGPPGGARDSHESAVAAALREAAEECDVPAGAVSVRGILRDDHGGWSYQTVIGAALAPFEARSASSETSDVAWVAAADAGRLALHPGFAEQWLTLRAALQPVTIIVDVANVMGSRPDGWWRDRAGAAARLAGELAALAGRGMPALPESMRAPVLERWFPGYVLVLEGARAGGGEGGAARAARGGGGRGGGGGGPQGRGGGGGGPPPGGQRRAAAPAGPRHRRYPRRAAGDAPLRRVRRDVRGHLPVSR